MIHGHRAFPGGMDGMTVLMLSLHQVITALLFIVNEGCHRFRIPSSSASSVPLTTPHDLDILRGYPFSNVDLVVQSVAGVIYPVDVQSRVIQNIVATVIGIDLMENPTDAWSLVQRVEVSGDTSSVISPPMQFRPKSAPLQWEPLLQGPRLASLFQVFAVRPLATSSIGCSGQSSAQLHTGILRVSDCVIGVRSFPLNNYLLIQFELVRGLTRYRFLHRTYL